jgi:preprotein translocase subunit SecE
VVFWTAAVGKEFFAYASESIDEAKRVVWPTRKETLQTTAVVFGIVLIMAIFLLLIDASLLWAVRILMGQGDS